MSSSVGPLGKTAEQEQIAHQYFIVDTNQRDY